MRVMDGEEFLAVRAQDDTLRRIRVLVHSSERSHRFDGPRSAAIFASLRTMTSCWRLSRDHSRVKTSRGALAGEVDKTQRRRSRSWACPDRVDTSDMRENGVHGSTEATEVHERVQ